jgi:hypothetical protein
MLTSVRLLSFVLVAIPGRLLGQQPTPPPTVWRPDTAPRTSWVIPLPGIGSKLGPSEFGARIRTDSGVAHIWLDRLAPPPSSGTVLDSVVLSAGPAQWLTMMCQRSPADSTGQVVGLVTHGAGSEELRVLRAWYLSLQPPRILALAAEAVTCSSDGMDED